MKLNLGSGTQRIAGFHNVDANPACRPDTVWDLERTPWPFETDSVEEIVAEHVLEHLGVTPAAWIAIWKEIYRICRHGAIIHALVPHPRNDTFLVDPTHVRPVFPETVQMFNQSFNYRCIEEKRRESVLGIQHGIDVEVSDVNYVLDQQWKTYVETNQVPPQEIERNVRLLNNVCIEIGFRVKIIKPQRHPLVEVAP